MHVVAEVVAVGGVFVEVAQRPCAADDGLYAEDVALLAVYLTLHHAGDIGLKLYVADEEQLLAGGRLYLKVALIGALLAAFGVQTQDAGGVYSLEAHFAEGAVVVVVDADMQSAAFRPYEHRAAFADHVLDEGAVVAVKVVVAKVETHVEGADAVGAEKPHLDTVGVCRHDGKQHHYYGQQTLHFCVRL